MTQADRQQEKQMAQISDGADSTRTVRANTEAPATDSLPAPSVLDPHHFHQGDDIQFGYDPGGPTRIVTVAEPDDMT